MKSIKRIFLWLFYSAIILFFGVGLLLLGSIYVNSLLFGYNEKSYNHEIDFLVPMDSLINLKPVHVYRSRQNDGIYFMRYCSNDLLIIECSNFKNISFEKIDFENVKNIKSSENKTYTLYYHPPFPVVEQVLHPKKSDFLKIILSDCTIENKVQTPSKIYLRGKIKTIGYSNTENCSMVTFENPNQAEVLIIKDKNKLFMIMQTMKNRNLQSIIKKSLVSD